MSLNRISLGVIGLCASVSFTSATFAHDKNWILVWADDFEASPRLDQKVWTVIEGNGCPQLCGFGNNELQTYTRNPSNLRLEDGKLIIEALKQNDSYTSAKITTQKIVGWETGKISMRAKLPSGVGTWPAFWMLPDKNTLGPWPRSGEIDVMEHVGHRQGYVHGTIHTEAFNGKLGTQKGGDVYVPTASTAFHTYSVEWSKESLRWFVDGKEYFKIDRTKSDGIAEWPFDQPFHIILNLAVGGNWGGAKGIDEKAFPARYEVDWVKVWQHK